MKSVCLVVQNIYDIDPRVRRKAEALVSAGYSVDVLALRGRQGKKNYSVNGANIRTVGFRKKRGSLGRYCFEYAAFFLWVFFRMPWQMMRRHYTAVDVNTLPDFLIFAPLLAKWMGAKLILDMHEITPEFYMSKYGITGNSLTVRLLKYVENISMRFADQVITINEPVENLLASRGLPRSKSTVVMNSVDEERFAQLTKALALRSPSATEKFVMMYHGTLTRIYGLDIAIEAFALVHNQMPRAELWILGSGPEQHNLSNLAQRRGLSSKVKLIGQVNSKEIPEWLSQCSAGILPIRCDDFLDFAFPNKLPEFVIMGKAILVSRLKAIRHYFSEGALAYADPNDPVDLARQMLRLYKDPELRAQLAAKASEEYLPIRWELMKQRYLTLMDRVTGRPELSAAAGRRATA